MKTKPRIVATILIQNNVIHLFIGKNDSEDKCVDTYRKRKVDKYRKRKDTKYSHIFMLQMCTLRLELGTQAIRYRALITMPSACNNNLLL